jgi:hypothetical protein
MLRMSGIWSGRIGPPDMLCDVFVTSTFVGCCELAMKPCTTARSANAAPLYRTESAAFAQILRRNAATGLIELP